MRMRPKPKKPQRREITDACNIYDGTTLANVVDHFEDTDLRNVRCMIELDDDYSDVYFYTKLPEPEKAYQERLEKYKKRLAKWQSWYNENKEEIEAELQKRKDKAAEKQRRSIEAAKIRAKRELEKIEKQLEKYGD